MSKKITERSRYLSYLLRHNPTDAGLTLDKEGWCKLAELFTNTDFTFNELCQIVELDSKGRYSFDHNPPQYAQCIRANQGHSVATVDITFQAATPPNILYHGTSEGALCEIINTGAIKAMNRQYVHLSADIETAKTVGTRHHRNGSLVLLQVDAEAMMNDGIKFFRSENGVWLVNSVDAKYFHQALPH